MTGGIPHYWQYYYPDEREQPLPLPEQIGRYGIVVSRPGEVFSYSNFSYALAAQLISAASGKSFSDFMRQEVFVPLGMNQTSLGARAGLERQTATGYDFENQRVQHSHFGPQGGAGFYSYDSIPRAPNARINRRAIKIEFKRLADGEAGRMRC
jgi:CubicO group peptidase (beta-lactamase class C family)